jgi:hypothetical protein
LGISLRRRFISFETTGPLLRQPLHQLIHELAAGVEALLLDAFVEAAMNNLFT